MAADGAYRFDQFRLQLADRSLLGPHGPMRLSSRGIDILRVLIERRGRIVAKDELIDLVWPDTFVEENNLTVHISGLRKIIGAGRIATIPGRGYQFTGQVESEAVGSEEPAPAPPSPANVAPGDRPPSNLPEASTPIIGREEELAELDDLVRQHRLLTLVGPSGIGKTRVATGLAETIRPRYPDGVWLVDLGPLTDPSMIPAATATALSVVPGGSGLTVDAVVEAVRGRSLLLLLDNCEHLLADVVSFADALLRRAPGVTILATSQEGLRSAWEQIYRIDPLEVPPEGAADVGGFGAVALFTARVRAVDRRFVLDARNERAVSEICRRLDGLPLALEMAAVRVPMLGVEGLLNHLDQRLHVLTTGARSAELRHRTLRHTLAWSHELLDPPAKAVFRRLAVFAGGFSLSAAAAVVPGPDENMHETIDALSRLIDKSLVSVDGEEPPRYRLLETLRLYALERLSESGEADQVAERHAGYFAQLFDEASAAWETTPDQAWRERYVVELDNARAALDWASAAADRRALAIKLTGASALLWLSLSLIAEGRDKADRVVALIGDIEPSADAARLLRHAGLLWRFADPARALALLQRSSGFYRRLSDRIGLGAVQASIASIHIQLGQEAAATEALTVATTVLAAADAPKSLGNVRNNLGFLALLGGRGDEARHQFELALDLARAHRDPTREALALANLAEVEFNSGAVDQAVARARETVARLRKARERGDLGWALANLASYLLVQGDVADARRAAVEALALVRGEGGFIVRVCLQQWALLGALDGRHELAARLLGFVDAGVSAAGETPQPTERQIRDRLWARLVEAVAPDELAAALAIGARWSEAEAVARVLDELATG